MTRLRSHPRLVRCAIFVLILSIIVLLFRSWQPPTPRRLSDMMTVLNPTWSADGTYLMTLCADSYDDTGPSYETCFAKSDLSNLIRLKDTPAGSYRGVQIWSPTGADLVVAGQDGLVFTPFTQKLSRRITMDAGCVSPAWSPDGQSIACMSDDYQIQVVDLTTDRVTQVTTTGSNFSPRWVGSKKALIFERNAGYDPPLYDIYVVDLATRTEHRLIANLLPFQSQSAVVAADGWHVVYPNEEETNFIIMDLHTGSNTLLAPDHACLSFTQYPQWSADGKYLAFTAERFAEANRQVYLFDTQTNTLFQITQFTEGTEGIVGTVAWSPDTMHLATAFDEHQRDDGAQILLISLAHTTFVPVDCALP